MAEKKPSQNNKFVQILEKIRGAKNILVTVSNEPTIDEVAAALGLTVMLDKVGKRATAIYSGELLQNMGFLKPDEIFEKNTHSLQEFIISIEKNKADSLRYKLEGDLVKIYLAPYKTKITKEDLNFSRGDYNVDMVILMNVESERALDPALAEHVRILHNSTTVNLTREVAGRLAQIEWMTDANTTMCEMAFRLAKAISEEKTGVDSDVATAFLAGMMAATDRFSNERTRPETLTTAAELMSLGANQQAVATGLMGNVYGFVGKSKTENMTQADLGGDDGVKEGENGYADDGNDSGSGYAGKIGGVDDTENGYADRVGGVESGYADEKKKNRGGNLDEGVVNDLNDDKTADEGRFEIINDGENEYDEDGILIEKNSKFGETMKRELEEELPVEKARKAEEELEKAKMAGEEARKQAELSDEIAEELRQVQAEMGGNLDETLENMKASGEAGEKVVSDGTATGGAPDAGNVAGNYASGDINMRAVDNLNGVPPMGMMPPAEVAMPMSAGQGGIPAGMMPPTNMAEMPVMPPAMPFNANGTDPSGMQAGMSSPMVSTGVSGTSAPNMNFIDNVTAQMQGAPGAVPMMPAEPMMTPVPFPPAQNGGMMSGGVAPIQAVTPESANRTNDPSAFNIPGM